MHSRSSRAAGRDWDELGVVENDSKRLERVEESTDAQGDEGDEEPEDNVPDLVADIRFAPQPGHATSAIVKNVGVVQKDPAKGVGVEEQRDPECDEGQQGPHNHVDDDRSDGDVGFESGKVHWFLKSWSA